MTTRFLIADARAFFRGMGSILDLSGTAFLPRRRTDAENLRRDWETVIQFRKPTAEDMAWALREIREMQRERTRQHDSTFGFNAGWWR